MEIPGGANGLRILVAEDDPNDRKLLSLAMREGCPGEVKVVTNGQEIIEYLRGEGDFKDLQAHPFPDLALLDLKMPVMGGFEVLRWIREESPWPVLPVMVLSGSVLENDVDEAYQLGANAFFEKPDSVESLRRLLLTIHEYWSVAKRPMAGTRADRV